MQTMNILGLFWDHGMHTIESLIRFKPYELVDTNQTMIRRILPICLYLRQENRYKSEFYIIIIIIVLFFQMIMMIVT